MLPREHRLRSSREIREVISRGKRASNQVATIHYQPANQNQFAIIVSKAVGNAVVRNLIKRRMRALLAPHTKAQPELAAAFRMKPLAATIDFQSLKTEVENLLERAR